MHKRHLGGQANGVPILGQPPPAPTRAVLMLPNGTMATDPAALPLPPGCGLPDGTVALGDPGMIGAFGALLAFCFTLSGQIDQLTARLERAGVIAPEPAEPPQG